MKTLTLKMALPVLCLWTAGRTAAQVSRIATSPVRTVSSVGNDFLSLDGKIYMPSSYKYFDLVNSPYSAIWESDGTPAGTHPMTYIDGASQLTPLAGNKFCFVTSDASFGIPFESVLGVSDGTPGGTQTLKSFLDIPNLQLYTIRLFASANGKAFLFSSQPALWVTDGTVGGTEKLVEFSSASFVYSGEPQWSIAHGDEVYFAAYLSGSSTQAALWKSDGTAAGTVLLKNSEGNPLLQPQHFVEYGGELFFSATDGSTGMELWKTDGTQSGTVLLKDIVPGSVGSSPMGLTAAGSKFYFSARDLTHGTELWSSDGTAGNTQMVRDVYTGSGSGQPMALTAMGNSVYFFANEGVHGVELWKSDGSGGGTQLVKDVNPGPAGQSTGLLSTGTANGYLFFVADDGTHGMEVWQSDGTAGNTLLARDILEGSGSGMFNGTEYEVSRFYTFADRIVFSADNGRTGFEPWISDGVTTRLLRDTNPASGFIEGYIASQVFPELGESNNGTQWFADQDHILFTADDPVYGQEPYISDGQAAPVLLKDLKPGSEGSSPGHYTFHGGQLYFAGEDAEGNQLWVSDGTTAGTRKIGSGLNPSNFMPYKGKLYFSGTGGLYATDGTTAGTVRVFEGIVKEDALPQEMNGLLYFSAKEYSSSYGTELWVTDGDPTLSAAHTHMLKDIRPGSGEGAPYNFRLFGNVLFFVANDGTHGTELWKSDGTAAGTQMVQDLNNTANYSGNARPYGLTPFNGQLYFVASDGAGGPGLLGSYHLFKTDGTAISLVKRLNEESDPAPFGFTVFNSKIYFTAKDPAHGYELWASDGTGAGTALVADMLPGPLASAPFGLIAQEDKLYFAATDQANGYEPRYLDSGGQVHLVADIKTGPAGSLSMPMVRKGNALYFWASDDDDRVALYKIGGSGCPDTLSPNGITESDRKAAISVSTATVNTIPSGADVTYQGGGFVELNPGFAAESGSVFVSRVLGGCQ
ncbi:hypothetical protein LAG90_18300 [Marinilongibacter aquaticus]|uniref:ELWxxDGT repeat protein n=1 Tax=Marinilongibacter aquaticus TaxID=2975157 RepID=UPI0021BD3DAD|nr:ELWxxDGT repeat protein [Marinilongibacter aquaticus]UBM58755.1 hypothetical protein LAG90_18300 [Marinilongibacter aquaticus]